MLAVDETPKHRGRARNLPLAVVAVDDIDARSRDEILSPAALAFLEELHERFEPQRRELLQARCQVATALRDGAALDFLPETREIREAAWRVAPPRED